MLFVTLALAAHYKGMWRDPGFLPEHLHAEGYRIYDSTNEFACHKCGADRTKYEPQVHHDRHTNRCVYKLDHFCLWTNNAVGATTRKYYFMFCVYTFLAIGL